MSLWHHPQKTTANNWEFMRVKLGFSHPLFENGDEEKLIGS